jgi:hypothetical protein
MAYHFCGEKGHKRLECKWIIYSIIKYSLMRFRRNNLLHLVAKRKERKPPLHKQKKKSSYVIKAFDNEYLLDLIK